MSEDNKITVLAEAMRADLDTNKHKSKLYRVEVNIDGGTQAQVYNHALVKAVSGAVAYNIEHDGREKVDLHNTEDVRQRLIEYCKACELAGMLPTWSGLCGWSLKISRQALNKFKHNNPVHPTTDLLNVASELFADAMLNTSLQGATNSIMSIFTLKSCAAFNDKPEAEDIEAEDDDGNEMSAEDIYRRYAGDNNDDSI